MLKISCSILNTVLNVKSRMVVSVCIVLMNNVDQQSMILIVYMGNLVGYWEITASIQHLDRVWYLTLLSWEKIKIQNLKYNFYSMLYPFHTTVNLENH